MRASSGALLRLAGTALSGHLPAAALAAQAPGASVAAAAAAVAGGGALRRAWAAVAPPSLLAHDPARWQQRGFASAAASSSGGGGGGEGGKDEAAAGPSGGGESEGEAPSVEQLTAELQEREKAVEELQTKVNELADSFKRSLAEMENLRQRTARQIENAQKFAVEPFIKSLLDVADNLQRAAEAVPAGALDGSEELDAERAQKLLRSLLQGVQMTEGVLMQVFRKHGVEQYNPAGDKFDPNLHQAMFEVPDPSKEAGLIAVVTKRGYKMHDRILRAAEVGVYKAP